MWRILLSWSKRGKGDCEPKVYQAVAHLLATGGWYQGNSSAALYYAMSGKLLEL